MYSVINTFYALRAKRQTWSTVDDAETTAKINPRSGGWRSASAGAGGGRLRAPPT